MKLSSTRMYRRRKWRDLIFPMGFRYDTQKPKELSRWIPDTHVHLFQAIDMFGASNIEGWSGLEGTAEHLPDDPDPPWDWNEGFTNRNGSFIISDSNEIVPTDENKARAWWDEIKPLLAKERDEEIAAVRRWWISIEGMRNALAANRYVAQIIDERGEFWTLTSSAWISRKGGTFITTGVGEYFQPRGFEVEKCTGPIVLANTFLSEREDTTDQVQLATSKERSQISQIDGNRFPYVAFMLRAIEQASIWKMGRTPKKTIEVWLRHHWPAELGKPSESKISNMASFLRRPEDEKGGLH